MKRLLFVVLFFILLLDAALTFQLIRSVREEKSLRSISMESDIPQLIPHAQNEKYFEQKLDELFFWDGKKVNLFESSIKKVEVSKLIIRLTDRPQNWARIVDTSREVRVLASYGQKYEPETKTMIVFIHLDKEYGKEFSLERRYTGVILRSLFDLTYNYPKNQREYEMKLSSFMHEYLSSTESEKIVRFGIL